MISQKFGLRRINSIMREGTEQENVAAKKTLCEICAVSQIETEVAGNQLAVGFGVRGGLVILEQSLARQVAATRA